MTYIIMETLQQISRTIKRVLVVMPRIMIENPRNLGRQVRKIVIINKR